MLPVAAHPVKSPQIVSIESAVARRPLPELDFIVLHLFLEFLPISVGVFVEHGLDLIGRLPGLKIALEGVTFSPERCLLANLPSDVLAVEVGASHAESAGGQDGWEPFGNAEQG